MQKKFIFEDSEMPVLTGVMEAYGILNEVLKREMISFVFGVYAHFTSIDF